jgi:hypothetical protein
LERELAGRPDVGIGDRAVARAAAHAVDLGEAAADAYQITQANLGYLRVRQELGLIVRDVGPADPFEQLMRDISAARVRNPTERPGD